MSIQMASQGATVSARRRTAGGGTFPRTIDVQSGTSLVISGLTASTSYGFTVQAYDASERSAVSGMLVTSTTA